jgi:hypothetical protein
VASRSIQGVRSNIKIKISWCVMARCRNCPFFFGCLSRLSSFLGQTRRKNVVGLLDVPGRGFAPLSLSFLFFSGLSHVLVLLKGMCLPVVWSLRLGFSTSSACFFFLFKG